MADPIPSADPALLAAQAKAGQAGVDAYNAAKNSLIQQRQQAVQQAMQEAALRGAPAGAMESLQSTITNPYDQGIAQMTAGAAASQADMAARDRSMADFNAAVLSERDLIPGQVEMAVAPIRARGAADVAQTEAQGRANVDQINANTQLALAKIQADQRASAAAAQKKQAQDAQLNQGQLKGLLPPAVADLLSQSSGDLAKKLSDNEQQRTAAAQAAFNQSHLSSAQESAAANAENAKWAAAYGGRGLQEAKGVALAKAAAQAFHGASAKTVEGLDIPPRSNSSAAAVARAMAIVTANQQPEVKAKQHQYDQILSTYKANPVPQGLGLQRLLAPLHAPLQQARDVRANTTQHIPGSDNTVGLTNDQVANLTPEERVMLFASGQQIMTPEALQQFLGDPTADINALYSGQGNNAGVANPASSDVVRAAYQQAAQQLQDQGGYSFGPEDLAAAMPDQVPSVYDFLQNVSNQPSAEDQFKMAQQSQKGMASAATAANKAQTKVSLADARKALLGEFGKIPPAALGDPITIVSQLQDQNTLADYQQAVDSLTANITNWADAKHKPTANALRAQLTQAAAEQGVAPPDPWVVSLALFRLGY